MILGRNRVTRYLTYALQFHRPPGESGGPAKAGSLKVTTKVGAGTVVAELEPIGGDEATLELSYALNHDKTLFFENGTVTFGGAGSSSLSFSSVGVGSLLGPPGDDGFSHGVVAWRIESGTGALLGASGAITSNFLVNLATDELVDTHLGVVMLPQEATGQ
jgi:hypothetical protein